MVEGVGTETSSLPISDSVDARRDGVVVPPYPTGKRWYAAIRELEGKEVVEKKGGGGERREGRETIPDLHQANQRGE